MGLGGKGKGIKHTKICERQQYADYQREGGVRGGRRGFRENKW